MEQEKALNALAPTTALLTDTTSPRMAAELILRATSTAGTYVFSELLYHPAVQSLRAQPDYGPHLRHLEIFAHGTYGDYASDTSLPTLTPQQTQKLRQLTLLTLSATRSALTYSSLQDALDLPSPREVEDLVITAIYAGLLTATLDPARQAVCVTSTAPLRDVEPATAIPAARAALGAWSSRCEDTLRKLDDEVGAIKAAAVARTGEKMRMEEVVSRMVEMEKLSSVPGVSSVSAASGASQGGGPAGRRSKRAAALGAASQDDDEGAMDLDDDDDGGEKKRNRRTIARDRVGWEA